MIKKLINKPELRWYDVENPEMPELATLSAAFGIDIQYLIHCLDREHLPKLKTIPSGINFLIVRTLEDNLPQDADTVQELTQKTVAFFGKDFILTLHSKPQFQHKIFCDLNVEKATTVAQSQKVVEGIINSLIVNVLQSYDAPLDSILNQIDIYEEQVFLKKEDGELIKDLFHIKRKANILKRMLDLTLVVSKQLPDISPSDNVHELVYTAERLIFRAEQASEAVASLLNIHLSLSAYRTNEVMRVLTLVSVFFMPITFIAGIYGMNFDILPELHYRYGYPAALLIMVVTAGGLMLWFRQRGWMRL